MSHNQDKIEKLGKSILDDAKAEAERILKEAHDKAEELLIYAEKEYRQAEENEIAIDREKTVLSHQKEMSMRDFAAHKDVLAHRNKLVSSMFDKIQFRIEEYTKTEDYSKLFASLVEKADREKPMYDGCVLYVKPGDEALARKCSKTDKIKVEADGALTLGGVSVFYPKESVFLNYTLDMAFEKQKQEFVNHGELSL